jgi:hypothetical protein
VTGDGAIELLHERFDESSMAAVLDAATFATLWQRDDVGLVVAGGDQDGVPGEELVDFLTIARRAAVVAPRRGARW